MRPHCVRLRSALRSQRQPMSSTQRRCGRRQGRQDDVSAHPHLHAKLDGQKIAHVMLLAIGFMTGRAVLSILMMITGDFPAMSLTAERVRPPSTPNAWRIERITSAPVLWFPPSTAARPRVMRSANAAIFGDYARQSGCSSPVPRTCSSSLRGRCGVNMVPLPLTIPGAVLGAAVGF